MTVGIVVACLLMIPAPPTAQVGPGGAAGIGIQAVSLAGRLATITERADAALLARKLARPAATAV